MAKNNAAHQRRVELDELLTGTFNSIMRIEERILNTDIAPGLTIPDARTIAAIGLYENSSMTAISTHLGVKASTLNSTANKLEREGYVKRTKSEKDKRIMLLSLTNEGRKVHHAHDLLHKSMVNDALLDLTEEEERLLAGSMSRVKAFFDTSAEAGYENQ